MRNNITIGMDLGDQNHVALVMDEKGNEIEIKTIHNKELSLRKFFSRYKKATVAMNMFFGSRVMGSIGCALARVAQAQLI